MGNGALATGPKLPRPSSTLPLSPFVALQRFCLLLRDFCRADDASARLTVDPQLPWPMCSHCAAAIGRAHCVRSSDSLFYWAGRRRGGLGIRGTEEASSYNTLGVREVK